MLITSERLLKSCRLRIHFDVTASILWVYCVCEEKTIYILGTNIQLKLNLRSMIESHCLKKIV